MLDGTDTSAGKRPSIKRHYAETRKFEKLSRKQLWSEPQLPRNHDGDAVAHSLGFLHVVSGQDGSALTVLKSGSHGPPTRRKRERFTYFCFFNGSIAYEIKHIIWQWKKRNIYLRELQHFTFETRKRQKNASVRKTSSHHMRCLDFGSIPEEGSSSKTIWGFPIMLKAKHNCRHTTQ